MVERLERGPVRVEGDSAFLPLGRGLEAIIDAEYVHLSEIMDRTWRAFSVGHLTYATTRHKGKTLLLHRIVVCAPKGILVDHINGNGLDNRHCNLRWATYAQNLQNRKMHKNNSSGYKGVYWRARDNKWVARIKANGKSHELGYFTDPAEAHAAYCEASARLHGEFGRTA